MRLAQWQTHFHASAAKAALASLEVALGAAALGARAGNWPTTARSSVTVRAKSRSTAPCDAYAVFDLAGVKTALLICCDVEFAPHIATLAGQEVQLILCPSANMQPFTHVVRFTVPANHGVSIVYANYCGTEGDLTYVGGSLIVDPDGEPLAQAPPCWWLTCPQCWTPPDCRPKGRLFSL